MSLTPTQTAVVNALSGSKTPMSTSQIARVASLANVTAGNACRNLAGKGMVAEAEGGWKLIVTKAATKARPLSVVKNGSTPKAKSNGEGRGRKALLTDAELVAWIKANTPPNVKRAVEGLRAAGKGSNRNRVARAFAQAN